jgi:hypothetical protein
MSLRPPGSRAVPEDAETCRCMRPDAQSGSCVYAGTSALRAASEDIAHLNGKEGAPVRVRQRALAGIRGGTHEAPSSNAGEHARRAASPPASWLNRAPIVAQLHAGPARLGVPDRLARRAGCWAAAARRRPRLVGPRAGDDAQRGHPGRPEADRRLAVDHRVGMTLVMARPSSSPIHCCRHGGGQLPAARPSSSGVCS